MDQTALPLADIAAATGFSSQSHLCTAMRQRLGLTPVSGAAASERAPLLHGPS